MKYLYSTLILTLINFAVSSASYKTRITVAKDGTGDFTSIQEAIYNTKAFPDNRITIYLKKGIYHEKVRIPAFNTHLSIVGEDPQETIITWDDHFNKIGKGRNSTFYTYTMKVEANDFYAENITIENTAGSVGQAVALHVTGDRVVFRNCRILGHQDTFYGAGEYSRQYFSQCYFEGTTDFIFGEATILFEGCQIHALSDSYITAASTPMWKDFGMVFINCRITASETVKNVYLGRPWRDYANVAFLNCSMGDHISPEGWANWNGTNRHQTAVFSEYGNTGPGADLSNRVDWMHPLTEKQAKQYVIENILAPACDQQAKMEMWTSRCAERE
ncbi:pectinesterase family protein [Thermophagus sp. OGC60D27]|uniref:pectinesterase family protein n=1 Tax=Thermophagus sp. OGC60D27 TaxID=3458415 RepID=UPI0040380CCF